MKTRSKVLLLIVSAMALVIATIFGTLAYLTDTQTVTNTFTVGTVEIELDEAKINADGKPINANDEVVQDPKTAIRVESNTYHLLPNHTYTKDPTVTVLKGSEESYVRMLVTINYSKELDEIFKYHRDHASEYTSDHTEDAFDITKIFDYNTTDWECVGNTEDESANTRTYEFYYIGEQKGTPKYTVKNAKDSVVELGALFTEFTVPSFFTKEDLAKLIEYGEDGKINEQFTISVEAHAIQADGFTSAYEAWTAFDGQCPADTTAAD